MIEEIKEVIVITKYKTKDGKIFKSKKGAEINEGILNGTVRICNFCYGKGEAPDAEFKYFYTCNSCKGSGYLHKKEVWSND